MRSRWLLLPTVAFLACTAVRAACPPTAELRAEVSRLDFSATSRVARFSTALPDGLLEQAVRHPGSAASARHGDQVFGVALVGMPVETLWKALNDEDHHALGERYVPVRHSEVIAGVPRGPSRLLFQYFQQLGIGRWWVSRVEMNAPLFASSSGRFWELVWSDRMSEIDPRQPPMNSISSRMPGIRASHGSWLLVPVTGGCTFVEHFSWTDPGGLVGAAQGLMAKRAVRDTVEGMVRLAAEHVGQPHPGAPFVRPDGVPLE